MIIYLSYDDAITGLASDNYYGGIFNGTFNNPNGCPVRATHFLTHQSTDYTLAHQYWSQGHEIATHSITHRTNTTYWQTMVEDDWIEEIGGMKEMIGMYANIPIDDVIGMRSPFLQGGGDEQFQMMFDTGLEYDSTMPSRVFGYTNLENGMWPYSLDWESTMDCQIEPCPTCKFPGIWEQPLLDLEDNWYGSIPSDPDMGQPCSMLDSCIINVPTAKEVRDMLFKNFERAYYGNTRAPMGLYMHAAWFFGNDWHYDGYLRFLEEIADNDNYPDVWILPIRAGIDYRKDPKSNDDIINNGYAPFDATCEENWPAYNCDSPVSCLYEDVVNEDINLSSIYMKICCPAENPGCCPDEYPWLRNIYGEGPTTTSDYTASPTVPEPTTEIP